MVRLRRSLILATCVFSTCISLAVITTGAAWASATPARTDTLVAGPYVIDVNLYQDQPFTGQPMDVTVVPHDKSLHLTGQVVAIPSSEIDATKLRWYLKPAADGVLAGSVNLPVRGAWQLVFNLDGPQGAGSAALVVTAAAPGAMPTWLAWCIGIIPVVAIAAWFLLQHRYRRTLALQNVGNA